MMTDAERIAALERENESLRQRAEQEIADREAAQEQVEWLRGTSKRDTPPTGMTEHDRGVLDDVALRNLGQFIPSDAHVLYADRVIANMRKRLNTERTKRGMAEV